MNRIDRSFKPLRLLPCWSVSKGLASFLTMEFGDPSLRIREPKEPTNPVTPRVRKLLSRRRVIVQGQWHLWVYCCKWCVCDEKGNIVGDWSSPRKIHRAAGYLDGQILSDVKILGRGARTCFSFDLGATLETAPYDRTGEQWLLYEPNGYVLTWRADRMYSYVQGNAEASKETWYKVAL
jgi:hypothetical protein